MAIKTPVDQKLIDQEFCAIKNFGVIKSTFWIRYTNNNLFSNTKFTNDIEVALSIGFTEIIKKSTTTTYHGK